MHPTLFLDRDGVICVAPPRGEYLTRVDQIELVDGIVEVIKTANTLGVAVIVITNQSQIARGMVSQEGVQEMHDVLQGRMAAQGARIDGWYLCPHHPNDACVCRKPKPGMLLDAARERRLDLARSVLIGDSDKDVMAGTAAGIKTIFLRNAHNKEEEQRCPPSHAVDRLADAIPFLRDQFLSV